MYCKNCGRAVEEGKTICVACEKAIKAEEVEEIKTDITEEVKNIEVSTQEPKKEDNTFNTNQTSTNNSTNTNNTQKVELKSKLAAGLFGIFLGAFGVHNFYLGYNGKGATQVSVTSAAILLSCCAAFFPFFIFITILPIMGMSIWGLIEGILILSGSIDKDGKGNPLKD